MALKVSGKKTRACTGTVSQVSFQSVSTAESSQTPSDPHSMLIENVRTLGLRHSPEMRFNVSSEIRHATIGLAVSAAQHWTGVGSEMTGEVGSDAFHLISRRLHIT